MLRCIALLPSRPFTRALPPPLLQSPSKATAPRNGHIHQLSRRCATVTALNVPNPLVAAAATISTHKMSKVNVLRKRKYYDYVRDPYTFVRWDASYVLE